MVDAILQFIKEFLENKNVDAVEFSIQLEDMLCDNYYVMLEENLAVTTILNEELPEICAACEQDADVCEFKAKIKSEYMRALDVR